MSGPVWTVAGLRFPLALHKGITGKPVIVQTTICFRPVSAVHFEQGDVIMPPVSSLFPDPSSRRARLLIVQPLVGIGDMVWHKPWIDHLATGFDVILAAKPTARSKTIFHGTDGIVEWLDIDRSMRGRRGRHDGIAGLLRLAADFRRARADAVEAGGGRVERRALGRVEVLTDQLERVPRARDDDGARVQRGRLLGVRVRVFGQLGAVLTTRARSDRENGGKARGD